MVERLPPNVVEALQQGRKVEAILRLRKRQGLDLADAKAKVEAYLKEYPHMMPVHKPLPRWLWWTLFLGGGLAYLLLTR